eukprot:gene10986-3692_t
MKQTMIKIYHNPKCSKSRATLKLIEEKGFKPQIVEYLKTPLAQEELSKIISLLSVKPIEIIRIKEPIFQELKLDVQDEQTDWLQIIIKNPILLERPIIIVNDEKAAIGRPPENILNIL